MFRCSTLWDRALDIAHLFLQSIASTICDASFQVHGGGHTAAAGHFSALAWGDCLLAKVETARSLPPVDQRVGRVRAMGRDDEAAEVARFLTEKGATVCPTVYAVPIAGAVPQPEEARRLAELELRPWLSARALQLATQHAERGRRSRRR